MFHLDVMNKEVTNFHKKCGYHMQSVHTVFYETVLYTFFQLVQGVPE